MPHRSLRAGIPILLLTLIGLLPMAAAQTTRRNCGTAWTGWVDDPNPAKNPCPKDCVRGERLTDRQYKPGNRIQYDVQYQCYAAEAPGAAPAPAGPAVAAPSAAAGAAASGGGKPQTKGPLAVPGAPQGVWMNWDGPPMLGERPVDGATAQIWLPALRALAQVIRESPALADLGGFYPELRLNLVPGAKPIPGGQLSVAYWPANQVEPDPAAKPGERRYRVIPTQRGFDPGSFTLFYNRFPTEPRPSEWTRDAAGEFFAIEAAPRQIAGFPVVEGHLLITAPGKAPLFLPVSQERAYRAQIAWAQSQIQQDTNARGATSEGLTWYNSAEGRETRRMMIEEAASREKDPARAAAARRKAEADDREQELQLREAAGASPGSSPITEHARKAIAELERRLGAMSEAERRAPAYMKLMHDAPVLTAEVLVLPGTPGARPLMAYNERFFDPKLPPGTLQLITMSAAGAFGKVDEYNASFKPGIPTRVYVAITEQTDWRRVGQMMK